MQSRLLFVPSTCFYIALFASLTCFPSSALTQAQAPATAPLLVNLTFPLDASRAKLGTIWHARVIGPWSDGTCQLAVGAMVEGHVSQVQQKSKADKKSAMHLVVDSAECNRQKGVPLKLTLYAMIGPVSSGTDVADVPVQGYGSGTAAPDVSQSSGGFRSVEGATQVNRYLPTGRSLPSRWRPGMVIDLPKMNLAVGAGVDGGSIVWATNTDARLEGQTTLLLMPHQ